MSLRIALKLPLRVGVAGIERDGLLSDRRSAESRIALRDVRLRQLNLARAPTRKELHIQLEPRQRVVGLVRRERLAAKIEQHGFAEIVGAGVEIQPVGARGTAPRPPPSPFPSIVWRRADPESCCGIGDAPVTGRALDARRCRPPACRMAADESRVDVVRHRQHVRGRSASAVLSSEAKSICGPPRPRPRPRPRPACGGAAAALPPPLLFDTQQRRRLLDVAVGALDAERPRERLHQRDDVLRRRVFRKHLEVAWRRRRPAAARVRGDGRSCSATQHVAQTVTSPPQI